MSAAVQCSRVGPRFASSCGDAGAMIAWLALVISCVSVVLTYLMYRRAHPLVAWRVEFTDRRFLLRNDGLSKARAVMVSGRNVEEWLEPRDVPSAAAEAFSFSQPPIPAQVQVRWRGLLLAHSCHVAMPPEHVDDPDEPDGGYDISQSIM